MMKKYKLIGEGIFQIIEMTEEDGTMRYVPIAEGNADYQAYIRSLKNSSLEENDNL